MTRQLIAVLANSFRKSFFSSLILIAGVLFAAPGSVFAQESDWTLGETDCHIPDRDWSASESRNDFHSSPTSQQIHFAASWGTKVLVSHDVEPAWVIEELKPSLWVKSGKKGVQLFARVVLPRSTDPIDSGPMTVLLPGPVYQASGTWQKLDFNDLQKSLPRLLEESVWKLRARYDQRVDETEAYVDKLVLNVYTGAGSHTVWIDDVEMPGFVAADLDSKNKQIRQDTMVQPVGFVQETTESNRRPALTRCNSTILEVRGQPYFARSVQHNGEPFEVLRELGFNTVELSETATIQQLRHAERLDMWIVCPPPGYAGLNSISAEFDRVLAWSMGNKLDHRDLDRIDTRKREIVESDFRRNRPVIGFASNDLFDLARKCDILSVGMEPIGSSFVLSHYSDWVQQRSQLADQSLPMWASVQTEIAPAIRDQTSAIASSVPPMPLEANQIKFMAYEALAGGARGLRFLSASRLDAADPVTNLRSLSLRWLNMHLIQLEPWISGGAIVSRSESRSRTQQLTTFSTARGKLVLIQRTSQLEQLVAGESPIANFRFSDPSLGSSENSYHLSESGMIPLDQGRAVAGNSITVENCGPLEAVVITQDAKVVNRLAESYMQGGPYSLAELHLEIARQWMTIATLINDQLNRLGQSQPIASGSINEANNALRQAQALVANGSAMTANQLLFTADQKLAVARREILSAARNQFASSTSSPLLTHISLVPLHFELIGRINPNGWQPNGLAGGDFENLKHMTDNQWENHRVEDPATQTHVELATSGAVGGQRSLMMTVRPTQAASEADVIDRTPLWIKSSAVPVKAGQLVRVHGWVNIVKPVTGSLDGFMIIDSIGGPAMAERMMVTQGWQEFTIYRCPTQDTEMRLTFALTGYGEVQIDEVNVRALDLNEELRQARRE